MPESIEDDDMAAVAVSALADIAARHRPAQPMLELWLEMARSCIVDKALWRKRLWRYERNGVDAEDILQEALVQAYLAMDRFRGDSAFETWFIAVVMNVARQHVAREVSRRRLVVSDNDREASMDDFDWSTFDAIDRFDPPQDARAQQLATDIGTALARVPAHLRTTFVTTCIEERTYEEAAELLGIPIGTVRSRVNRTRTLLRHYLGGIA